MKQILVIIGLCLLSNLGFSQNERFVAAMEKQLAILDTAQSATSMQMVANGFERIANAEKSEWLPLYYASYIQVVLSAMEKDKNKKDEWCDKAAVLAALADSLSHDNSEILALHAFILQMKLSVNPMVRGAKYGPEAGKYLEKAKKTDPENPRVYYLQGESLMHTPAMFGGGIDKACPVLQQAVEKYAKFKPLNTIMPNWGKERAETLYKDCGH